MQSILLRSNTGKTFPSCQKRSLIDVYPFTGMAPASACCSQHSGNPHYFPRCRSLWLWLMFSAAAVVVPIISMDFN